MISQHQPSFRRRAARLSLILALLLPLGDVSSKEPSTPAPGSETRRAICDALREKAYPDREKKGQEVRFVIDHLKVAGEWACLVGTAQITPKPKGEDEVPALSAVFQKSPKGKWICLGYDYHGDLSTARELFGDVPVPDTVLPEWMRSEKR